MHRLLRRHFDDDDQYYYYHYDRYDYECDYSLEARSGAQLNGMEHYGLWSGKAGELRMSSSGGCSHQRTHLRRSN